MTFFWPLVFHNLSHYPWNPSALHAIHTPRRIVYEVCETVYMTVIFDSMLNLFDILTTGTKSDTIDKSKQMTKLRIGKSQFQCKKNFTIDHVEEYHINGKFPLNEKTQSCNRPFLHKWNDVLFSFSHSTKLLKYLLL